MPINWIPRRTYTDILYETAEGIAKITINRPEVRNAFRPQTLFELMDAFAAAREDASVGVVIFDRRRHRGVLLRRRSARARLGRVRRRRWRAAAECLGSAARDPHASQTRHRHGGRLCHRRRTRAAPGLRPDHRRRQRRVRSDRAARRQLRRRLRRHLHGAHRRPQEGARDLVSVPALHGAASARIWGW